MTRKLVLLCILVAALGIMTVAPAVAQDEFVFGMVLVGPQNDRGWSQAHFEGGQYVEQNVPGAKMLVFEKLNPADAPETTLADVVAEMVDQGAKLVFTASDEFEEDTAGVAVDNPDVTFINVSGDDAYTGEAPANLGNVMGQMEWAKMMAGCAAALTTQTGSIGYLGPLINFETRRLAASAYLGAKYCYETYRGMDPASLTFTVTWIGFWFNIPGVTLDPTEETNSFFDNGADVVLSGIDTTEAIVVTGQRAAEGEQVWAVPYDFMGACDVAPEICLGVPYFHWGPVYKQLVEAVIGGTYVQSWDYVGPDWADINNQDTSAIGFVLGPGLSDESKANMEDFIAKAAAYATDPANEGTFLLWEGPLAYQDGTVLAEEGAKLPMIAELGEAPSVWYLEQLLDGMVGASTQQ
ncbi:MAG: BMP family ABC transporter substrate-binding protein [Anaerolineae bacterium]|nr:BMP family ABC transporter substrate-binding protein [Anaerolineae bacterium]